MSPDPLIKWAIHTSEDFVDHRRATAANRQVHTKILDIPTDEDGITNYSHVPDIRCSEFYKEHKHRYIATALCPGCGSECRAVTVVCLHPGCYKHLTWVYYDPTTTPQMVAAEGATDAAEQA